MNKNNDALKTIGEVSESLNLKVHVIRFWKKKFDIIRPIKKQNGTRYFNQEQIIILKRIKNLLYERKLTIKGAILEMKKPSIEKNQLIYEIETLINEIKHKLI